jgi:hypothetical protein
VAPPWRLPRGARAAALRLLLCGGPLRIIIGVAQRAQWRGPMAETISNPDSEGIINAVKQLNAGYNNTDYGVRQPEDVAGGKLYTVVFRGENKEWMENYVFVRGKFIKAYFTVRDVIVDSNNSIVPKWRDQEFIKLAVVSLLTVMFALAVVGIVLWNPDNKSLQVLTGLLGLTLGYFVGKSDSTNV